MKAFTNADPRDIHHAATLAGQARRDGRRVAFAGGGSDLLALVKDRILEPDLVIHLGAVKGVDRVEASPAGLSIGGLITLDALSRHDALRGPFAVLAEAAGSVATPQIRNVGTLAGNVCQRPWCWYFRNGFPCYKAGGKQCFSVSGENEFHAIFGGGPSYIVHPSDTAPALVALDATFQITGPSGDRSLSSAEFFTLPRQNAARENALADDEVLASVRIPARPAGARSTYRKVMDRETWTHAVVSAAVVLDMEQDICRTARVVLGGVAPIPWRVEEAEKLLAGQRLSDALLREAGDAAVAGARPLSQNAYKVPLARNLVRRTLADLAAHA